MKLIIVIVSLLFIVNTSYAAGVVARQKEMQRQGQEVLRQKALQQSGHQPVSRNVSSGRRQSTLSPVQRRNPDNSASGEEEVFIDEIWLEMETSSTIWSRIIDLKPKEATVDMYIDWYEDKGIHISKSALTYVNIIDNMVSQNPTILDNPFRDVLKVVAIIEYDFDNGQNKDVMARKILGEQAYARNKKRLGR